jgi:hypothetical protein
MSARLFLNHLPTEGFFDSLRGDPRLNELVRRMGFPVLDLRKR